MNWLLVIPAAWAGLLIVLARVPVARRGDERARKDASLTAGVMAATSVAGILLALLLAGVRCDELCDASARGWRYDPNAWQWMAQLGCAGVGLIGAFACLALLDQRAFRAAGAAMTAHAVGWTAWGLLLVPFMAR